MPQRLLISIALGACCLVAASPGSAVAAPSEAVRSAEPAVFSDAGLEADRARSISEGRVHVIYATASWCPPCRKMKAETWIDDTVVEWLNANAVVTPLDVDAFAEEAQRLRVRAMPTIMAFDGTTEIARTVGYQAPGAFRGWLERSTGRGMPAAGSAVDARITRGALEQRLADARLAARESRFADAAEGYAFAWDHMRQGRDADDERRGGVAREIASLIAADSSARQPFAQRRDAIGAERPSPDSDDDALLDWMTLNGVLGDDGLTVAWIAESFEDRRVAAVARSRQRDLRPMLTAANQWSAAAAVVDNPFASARLELMELKRSQRATGAAGIDGVTLASLADLYAIARVSDRAGIAERVAALVLRAEDSGRVRRALVGRALDAGAGDASVAELIEGDTSDEAASLRARLAG